jgi:hypothetical protein
MDPLIRIAKREKAGFDEKTWERLCVDLSFKKKACQNPTSQKNHPWFTDTQPFEHS